MPSERFSILMMTDMRRTHANTSLDHIDAFEEYSRNDVYYYDPLGRVSSRYLELDEFDVLVVHYSLMVLSDYYLHPFFREKLSKYQGLKIQFIQDEYRQVEVMCRRIREVGTHILFSLYPPEKLELVYSQERLPGVKKYPTLAGYVPEKLLRQSLVPLAQRPLDIGYRGREVPYWLGHLGQDKVNIVKGFHRHIEGWGLRHDVSCKEEDRIYGPDWPRFIESCKAMLGTESGSSITDFDGGAQKRVGNYLSKQPSATYEEVHQAVLGEYEGNVVLNCISPRAFETAALRTAMVLFPGEYSGLLKPWVHYIPLAKDFSNFSEVVRSIKDHDLLAALVDRAHADLVASELYSYRAFVEEFDKIVERHATHHGSKSKVAYGQAMQEPVPKPALGWRSRLKNLMERAGVPPWLIRKFKRASRLVPGSPRDSA